MGYCFGISTVGWYALSTGWLDFIEDNKLRANSYYFGDCLAEPLPYACATETGGEFAARVEEKTNAINLVGRSAIQITLNDCGAPGATFSSSSSEGARKTSHLHRQFTPYEHTTAGRWRSTPQGWEGEARSGGTGGRRPR
jgi:hypothetical protein